MLTENMKKETVPCMICGRPVSQDSATSVERQTCKRIEVNGVLEKSECEKEKLRRYQKEYRDNNSTSKPSKKTIHDKSVAVCSLKHLAKHKAKKYKRDCLKCGKKFTGVGAYNRICNTCTIINSRQSYLKGV